MFNGRTSGLIRCKVRCTTTKKTTTQHVQNAAIIVDGFTSFMAAPTMLTTCWSPHIAGVVTFWVALRFGLLHNCIATQNTGAFCVAMKN
jgi:uncharacterized membrane protein